MVGIAAPTRVVSVTAPVCLSSGTFRSSRSRTRLPRRSRSRRVRYGMAASLEAWPASNPEQAAGWPRGPLLAARGSGQARPDERRQVGDPAGVAPLVVVPGADLGQGIDDERIQRAEDRGVRVALQVAGHQRLLGVCQDAPHLIFGVLAH